MKFHSLLLCVLAFAATGAFAAPQGTVTYTGQTTAMSGTHILTSAPVYMASANVKSTTPATNAPPAAPAQSGSKFDDYIGELTAALKLSDADKKQIEDWYATDGATMKDVLNKGSLSPLQKARQVSDLRDTRNTQIEALLEDADRKQAFLKIEAKYRVALTELAADHGLIAAPTAPAPAAAPATNAPAAATNAPAATK